MLNDFRRVVIVNRGEAAMRFIHAAREFNQEHGASLCTIALYTDPDRHAMFVREADEAVSLGAAQVLDPRTRSLKSAYVDYNLLKQALLSSRAEAVWVGWGFVAEHAQFADMCRSMGIVFIGPDGDVMRLLGDKISSKQLAAQADVPIAPWSGGPVEMLPEAHRHADRIGYPLMIKATAGGGGHGIRLVHSAAELEAAFESARSEAFKAFGDPTVFLEQFVAGPRHVEVQVIADHYGTVWAAGVRDCTVQRHHQKVMEEAPSPALTPEQDAFLRSAAVRLTQLAGYHNAGTVEFLYKPESKRFLFMEMNTRLQVEHPVTECTTGLDLVKLQIHVARGGRLEGAAPKAVGHAIEVRLNAEDPENGFLPGPGTIERFMIATGPGIRIDTGVSVGDTVPKEFDSMVAKIIAYGQTRAEALSRIQRVLRESVVVIRGGATNKAFLLELVSRAEVQHGQLDVKWLDRLTANGEHVSRRYADVALVQAAIEIYNSDLAVEKAQFYTSAVRGRPQVRNEAGRVVKLRYRGQSYDMRTYCLGPERYRVDVDGSSIDAHLHRLGPFEYWLTTSGQRSHIVSVVQGLSYRIEVDGVSHRIERDDGGMVLAPAPAVVVSIAVKPGDKINAGDRLLVLEAMKMETQVVAPFSGTVRQILTIPNVQVDIGAPLIQLEPAAGEESTEKAERVVFSTSLTAAEKVAGLASWRRKLDDLRQLMLGFDVEPAHIARTFEQWSKFQEARSDTPEIRRQEDEILNIFVDICSLFRRKPSTHDSSEGEAPSPESFLFTYLRTMTTQGEGLPASFVDALRRALAHYGITSLDPTPELEETLLWIYKSHQRLEAQAGPIMALLERRLPRGPLSATESDESFRSLLDRVASITRENFPAVSDMAREVRYRCFDQPVSEDSRKLVYAQMEEILDRLTANPETPDRERLVRELIDCPQPLATVLSRRCPTAAPAMQQIMLRVMTSRYYRERQLTNFRPMPANGNCCVSAEYQENGKRAHVFTTHADYPGLLKAARSLAPALSAIPAEDEVVLDFVTWKNGELAAPDLAAEEIRSVLQQAGFARAICRIVVAVSGPNRDPGMAGMQHFTYEPSPEGFAEVKLYRGIHPMMAERLHLWRLVNFNIDRLPSPEDVYLLHAVARENPKDERLFACAEVRDLTPVRDEQGRVVQLPNLERMFAETLAGIRLFQMKRPANKRLHWNRILLYVWPPLAFNPDELEDIARRLGPATDGLGLEQVAVRARMPNPETGELREVLVRISNPGKTGLLMTMRPAARLQPLKPLAEYDQKVVKMRQRGLIYPYEIVRMLTPSLENTRAQFPTGDFVEYDLDVQNQLIPVDRPHGQNKANIVVGVIRNFTPKYPEGMTRVMLLGDPSKDMGALAEPECRRINAAIDLAETMHVPLEWFPISAGAKISMNSGVENMDWIARVLRRIIEFTQAGGEVNLVVNGINVGAQPYWNSEATMLLHTRGILIMTPPAAMVLTGKRALDYSGSVSAEDNQGIGGYDRIMGLNGQAQYFARDIDEACRILFRHYEHTYVLPGERFPRRAASNDPVERDVCDYPHGTSATSSFHLVGEIFSDETNPGRKKPFEIRRVMAAVVDQDHTPLERWSGMRDAETVVVWDAHLGGYPVCMLGIESHPVPRLGFVPADGPDQWTAGTLFPASSKKAARAINAASNNRPLVVLANLSGFDGSPESLRKLQLEYGAEIGRAVVNFKGPMVFCVVSRYHGGAYVVFSQALNERMQVVALEGTYASVIGGAPAAAVVFSNDVETRARKDLRLAPLSEAIAHAEGAEKGRLRKEYEELYKNVHSEKLGEVAAEFDQIHSVQRALKVGALSDILPPRNLRSYLVQAVECGIAHDLQAVPANGDGLKAALQKEAEAEMPKAQTVSA